MINDNDRALLSAPLVSISDLLLYLCHHSAHHALHHPFAHIKSVNLKCDVWTSCGR